MPDLRTDTKGEAGEALTIPLRRDLPSGTVTFLFTDIEGSTPLTQQVGSERWQDVLEAHARIIRSAAGANEGVEVRTEGDSFFLAFRGARSAVKAAVEAQRAFAAEAWPHGVTLRVRMGMHTGENAIPGRPESGADYIGNDVVRAARISAAGHGGQVLISSATRALLGSELPDGVTLRDLGQSRLKGLQDPEDIYQIVIAGLRNDFPTLRTLSAAPNNLPAQVTSFVGRRRELAEAKDLLSRTRLLTLVGPGGTGKSRLSLELASQVVADFEDGVWFVRLAAVTDPDLVASEIAKALGLVVPPNRAPLDHLLDHLKDKQMLLVLDNFEQVVRAATDVGRIVGECLRVKVIVSTRIVLHVSGEQEYPVPPLALPATDAAPDLNALSRSESVQLFLERARGTRPDFALTVENGRAIAGIVAQLDGLPLAIELAAARVKILPPQAILERLASGLGVLQSSARDLPARQQTLRGAIAWSYDLLDPGLRKLFQRLAVFRGGGSLDQIERVCGPADQIGRDVLDGIAELVDQSLIRRFATGTEPRFVMLETIREYARERLDESGEAEAIELRHARAYLELAREVAPGLTGPRQRELLDRLEVEQGNLRVALDICSHAYCADRSACECGPEEHSADDTRIEISLRLAGALWRFWQMRGHLAEGRQRTERILTLPNAQTHREAYLVALEAAGGITYWQGDMIVTERLYRQRLDLAREVGDRVGIASALYDLAFIYILPNSEPEVGPAMLNEAIAGFRAAGDRAGVAKASWALATTYFNRSDWAMASALLDEVVTTFRELDDRFGLGWALHSLGVAGIRLGRMEEARAAFVEGLGLFRDAGDLSGIVLMFFDFAELAASQQQDDQALRLFGASEGLMERTGTQLAAFLREENRPFTLEVRALLERTDPARRDALAAEGRAFTLDAAIDLALTAPQPLGPDRKGSV